MARKTKRSNFGFNVYLLSGLLLISIFSVWRYHQQRILSFNVSEVAKVNFSGVKPVHVKAYPVGVDVSIKDGVIKDGVWAIYPKDAVYLLGSAGLGDSGNTIIYGHNKDDVLGPIRWVKLGSIIEVLGSDGSTYKYKVVKIDEVDPNNLSYIQPTKSEILTLYTCTGFLDSKRFIVVAERI